MTVTNMKAALVPVTNTVLDSFHRFSENFGSRNFSILSKYHLNSFEIHVLDFYAETATSIGILMTVFARTVLLLFSTNSKISCVF